MGTHTESLLFTIMKNNDFLGSLDTNLFRFPHYETIYFSLYINCKQTPSGGLHLDTGHEKTSVMAYRTLFEASGIRHLNSGLQITHMFVTGYCMLLFDLTPDHGASQGHTSHPDGGNIRIELKFKALSVAITCLLYLEYNCVRIDSSRNVTTDFS